MSDPDVRQSELKEGAGLEDSQINAEFLETLQVWGPRILYVLAAVVLAYWGYGRLQQMQNDKVNSAYSDYAAVAETANPNPVSLRVVAEEHGDVRSIGIQTRLREADVYLDAVRSGLVPGAVRDLETGEFAEEDSLSDEDRAKYLDDAESLYKRVIAEAGREPGAMLHSIGARFGLAAVLEERGDAEGARGVYAELAEAADAAGYAAAATVARGRAESVDEVLAAKPLPSQEDLPKPPEPEPETADASEPVVDEDPGVVGPQPGTDMPETPADEEAEPAEGVEPGGEPVESETAEGDPVEAEPVEGDEPDAGEEEDEG